MVFELFSMVGRGLGWRVIVTEWFTPSAKAVRVWEKG